MIQSVNKYHIYEIFSSDGKFYYSIPKYQREYTWGYREWEALYDDISENSPEYFIGSIICIPLGDTINPYMEVIDGQQRLTTISLFLAAIYREISIYKEFLSEDDEDILPSLRKSLKSSLASNELKVVPQVQNHNQEDYNFIMSELGLKKSASVKASYFASRKMARCYNFYVSQLEREIENKQDSEKIVFLLDKYDRLKQAMLVKMEVSSHSDAYVLFESLNNRGTPLTAIDLMKNLIMARAEINGLTTDDCFNRWQQLLRYLSDEYKLQERFFRQYYNAFRTSLNVPFKTDEKKKYPLALVATKSNLLQIFEKLINNNLTGFLEDILLCGELYAKIAMPWAADNECLYTNQLKNLFRIQGAPSYILLLYLIKNEKTLKLSSNNISDTIDLLIKFFVRRNITDKPATRDLARIFMDIIVQIEDKGLYGDDIFNLTYNYIREISVDDHEFRKSLNGDIYKENVDATRYILCALAQHHMTKETWTDLWARDNSWKYIWTIEHIFPEGENIPKPWIDMIADGDIQKAVEIRELYVHKLGNLTLTGYNSQLSNLAYDKKRDRKDNMGNYVGYKNGLELNQELAKKDSWTKDDIIARTNELIDETLEMFSMAR